MSTKSREELRRMALADIARTSPEADAQTTAAALADPDAQPVDDLFRNRGGRPRKAVVRQQIALRLEPEVIERFKAGGPGWQTRMSEALRKAAGL